MDSEKLVKMLVGATKQGVFPLDLTVRSGRDNLPSNSFIPMKISANIFCPIDAPHASNQAYVAWLLRAVQRSVAGRAFVKPKRR